jgi:UDP-GlcNAc:undecaprenyl-phosphate GlcNAc-1-phosphate transferase
MFNNFNVAIVVVLALALACIVTYLLTPAVKQIACKIGAIDVPKDNRRMHKEPIPRMGGLAIFLGFFIATLLFNQITDQMRSLMLGAVIIVVLGVLDDKFTLRAWPKLLVQIAAALVAVLGGNAIHTLSNPNLFSPNPYWNLGVWSIPISVLWIVAITNAVNLIDGLDGLAVGVSTISAFTMLVIALLVSDGEVAILMGALCGACLGFLPYNKNPAQIFMGDTGSTFLGYILAVASIQGLFKFYSLISFVVPFLMLGLPLFDTGFAFIRRISHGQSPMKADRSHVHHRLIDMGLSQKQAVAVLYVISAILGVCAVVLTTSGALRALIFLAAVVVAGLVVFKIYTSKNDLDQDTEAQAAEPAENSPGEPSEEPHQQEETPAEPEAVPSAPQDPPVGEDTEENNGCNQSE